MSDPIELLVDALAAYRLTRLISADTITLPIRGAVIRAAYIARDGDQPAEQDVELDAYSWEQLAFTDDHPPKIAELVTCRWCTGMWVSFGIVAARRFAPRAWSPVARALSCAAAAALVARLETD